MATSLFVPIVGQLVRAIRPITVPTVTDLSLQNWHGDEVRIPADAPLMFLGVAKSTLNEKGGPYWKTYLLFGEKIVYYSGRQSAFHAVFKYVDQ